MRMPIDPTRSVRAQVPDVEPFHPMAASVGSAVYRFFDAAEDLLYVGITSRPRDRWYAHSRRAPWWRLVASVEITDARFTLYEAQRAECRAIRDERPAFNIAMTGASSTPPGELTESSLTTPIGKGREGKRKGTRVADALVKVRSTLAESDKSASPIVKAVAREASTGGWRC